MNKLLALIRSEWKTAFDPKSIVLNSMDDVKKNALALKQLSHEDRQMLAEYVLRAEVAKTVGRDASAVYGISVGSAIEAQQKLMFRNHAMG